MNTIYYHHDAIIVNLLLYYIVTYYVCFITYFFIHLLICLLMHFLVSCRHEYISPPYTSACISLTGVQYLFIVLFFLIKKTLTTVKFIPLLSTVCLTLTHAFSRLTQTSVDMEHLQHSKNLPPLSF